MNLTKDYLKFRNAIKKDYNLTIEEAFLYESLYDSLNIYLGYSYLGYKDIMLELRTKRKIKVSNLLKSLVAKGYIYKKRNGIRNNYYLKKYVFMYDSANKKSYDLSYKEDNEKNDDNNFKLSTGSKEMPVDSNGQEPVKDQIHFSECENVDDVETYEKITALGYTTKQAKELITAAKNNITRVIKSIEYSRKRGKANAIAYVKWCINNFDLIAKTFNKNNSCSNKFYKEKNNDKRGSFYNIEERQYNYNNLERALLYGEDLNINLV